MTDNLPTAASAAPGPNRIDEITRLTAELDDLGAEAQQLTDATTPDTTPGSALVPSAGSQATEAKTRMTRQLARLKSLEHEIDTRRERLRRLMTEQMHSIQQALEPLRAQAARMQEGIDAISLYLGIEESIETLRDGTPAPADTPVTLRQLVLSADQECMVAADTGGLDVRGLDDFFAWLLADPANLDQVLPEPKGIVAMVPRRTERRYGNDPWFNAAMRDANAATFFLIRNGQRLHVAFNEIKLDRRLFPAADEFTRIFRDHRGHPMEPGSYQWKKAEEAADATRRHYMKVGLLLQGLVDRTTVLHPHPAQGLNLLDQDAIDTGQVVLIPDAEDNFALEDGRERFTAWQQRVNAHLRPGMRIIVATHTQAFRDLTHDDRHHGHTRLYPATAEAPDPNTVHTIEQRRPDGGLVIRYHRTDDVWTDHGLRPSKTRASCTVRADDPFVLAYDAPDTDPALLRAFLHNRIDRQHYLDMVPVINAAIAAKNEERATEAPFRQMVVGMLLQQPGMDPAQADNIAADLVDWWKFANRFHRPLTGRGPEADAKAVREITAEYHRRRHDHHHRAAPHVIQVVTDKHPDALLIAQTHAGHLVALTPIDDGPFVTEHTYNRYGQLRTTKEWVLPGARPNRWTTLHTTTAWNTWDRGATLAEHLTGPERDTLAQEAIRLAHAEFPDRDIAAVTLHGTHTVIAWTVTSWGHVDEDHPATITPETVTVEGIGFPWHRDRHQQPAVGFCTPFGRRLWGRMLGRHPWESSTGQVTVLRQDTDVIERAEACHARYQTADQRRREIHDAALRAYRTAQAMWDERQEQEAYQKFLVEFGEPDLWEGHRKTLTLPPMPESPDHPRGSTRIIGTSWFNAFVALIEEGENIADYTFGKALESQGVADVPAVLYTLPLHRQD